jgi:hypothetical protein
MGTILGKPGIAPAVAIASGRKLASSQAAKFFAEYGRQFSHRDAMSIAASSLFRGLDSVSATGQNFLRQYRYVVR